MWRLVGTCALVLLVSCASKPEAGKDELFQAAPPAPSGYATLVMLRGRAWIFGGLVPYYDIGFLVNGTPVALLGHATYSYVYIREGKTTAQWKFSVVDTKLGYAEIDAVAGETYFLKWIASTHLYPSLNRSSPLAGDMTYHFSFIDPSAGRKEWPRYRYVEPLVRTVERRLAFGQPPRVVNLDDPGVLDALAHNDPRSYGKVREIISGVYTRPESEMLDWLQSRFDALDVTYEPIYATAPSASDQPRLIPPVLTLTAVRHRLSFTIDKVRYQTIIWDDHFFGQARFLESTDVSAAIRLYKDAARNGNSQAALRLGEIYERGAPGVPANTDESIRWYNAARALGANVSQKKTW